MSDPDGVQGQAVQQATVKTRGVPKIYRGGRTLHVYPPDYKGPRNDFTGNAPDLGALELGRPAPIYGPRR